MQHKFALVIYFLHAVLFFVRMTRPLNQVRDPYSRVWSQSPFSSFKLVWLSDNFLK